MWLLYTDARLAFLKMETFFSTKYNVNALPLYLLRPTNSKDYIHRVGRTARAGRAGKSITMVCQYDVEIYQKIEAAIGKKLEEWPHEKDQIMVLKERVDEAKRIAEQEIKVTFFLLFRKLQKIHHCVLLLVWLFFVFNRT